MIVAPGCFSRNASAEQRGDEVAGNELAAAVDEEAAVGVAVPGDADVGLLADDLGGDVAAVLLDQRIGFVVREGAVDLEAQLRHLAGKPVEQLRRDQPGHAAAGVEHDGERLDDRRIDEGHHLLDVVGHDVPRRDASRACAAGGGQAIVGDHVADVADPGVAAQRQRTGPHHLHAVVLPGLCDAVICAPPPRSSRTTAK